MALSLAVSRFLWAAFLWRHWRDKLSSRQRFTAFGSLVETLRRRRDRLVRSWYLWWLLYGSLELSWVARSMPPLWAHVLMSGGRQPSRRHISIISFLSLPSKSLSISAKDGRLGGAYLPAQPLLAKALYASCRRVPPLVCLPCVKALSIDSASGNWGF